MPIDYVLPDEYPYKDQGETGAEALRAEDYNPLLEAVADLGAAGGRVAQLEAQRLTAAGDGTTDDTASINAQLAAAAAGAVLRGVPGKTYKISAPLVLRPGGDMTLDMTGCTVTLASGSNCNLLQNAAAAPLRSTTDGATTTGSTTVTSATAAFTSADVGRMITVAGAGPNAQVLYGTIATVTNATTATITPSTAAATGAAATVTGAALSVYRRDTNITIRGGTWARGANDGVNNARHSLFLRRIDGLRIDGVEVTATAGKYAVNLADVRDYWVRDPKFNISSDGVHVIGPATGGHISGVRGLCGDDAVSFTAQDFAAYNDVTGDIIGCEVDSIVAATPTTALVKFATAPGVLIDGIHCRGLNQRSPLRPAFAFADDTGTLNIGEVTLTDVVGRGYIMTGTVDSIVIRNWRWTATQDANLGLDLNATIARLSIAGAYGKSSFANTHMIQLSNSASVDHLQLDGIECTGGTGAYLVRQSGATTTVGRAQLSNIRRDCPTASGGLYQASISGNSLTDLMLSNVVLASGSWIADLITSTTIWVGNVRSTTSGLFNVRVGSTVIVQGAHVTGGTSTNAGTLRSRTFGYSVDVSLLSRTANDIAFNTNAALACGAGPVVCDGTSWKHLYTAAVYT